MNIQEIIMSDYVSKVVASKEDAFKKWFFEATGDVLDETTANRICFLEYEHWPRGQYLLSIDGKVIGKITEKYSDVVNDGDSYKLHFSITLDKNVTKL